MYYTYDLIKSSSFTRFSSELCFQIQFSRLPDCTYWAWGFMAIVYHTPSEMISNLATKHCFFSVGCQMCFSFYFNFLLWWHETLWPMHTFNKPDRIFHPFCGGNSLARWLFGWPKQHEDMFVQGPKVLNSKFHHYSHPCHSFTRARCVFKIMTAFMLNVCLLLAYICHNEIEHTNKHMATVKATIPGTDARWYILHVFF